MKLNYRLAFFFIFAFSVFASDGAETFAQSQTRLTGVLEPLAAKLEPTRKAIYKSVGGRDLELHIFEPEGHDPARDRRPCFLIIHGGGWTGGEPRKFYTIADHYAKKGMLAISLQYRLIDAKAGVSVFDCVKDGRSAVRWLRAHARMLGIDPKRVAVSGGSAGGHVALGTAVFENSPDVDESTDDLSVSCVPDLLIPLNPVIDTSADGYGQKARTAADADLPQHWRHGNALHGGCQVRRVVESCRQRLPDIHFRRWPARLVHFQSRSLCSSNPCDG